VCARQTVPENERVYLRLLCVPLLGDQNTLYSAGWTEGQAAAEARAAMRVASAESAPLCVSSAGTGEDNSPLGAFTLVKVCPRRRITQHAPPTFLEWCDTPPIDGARW
jgi:hypothetical protein